LILPADMRTGTRDRETYNLNECDNCRL